MQEYTISPELENGSAKSRYRTRGHSHMPMAMVRRRVVTFRLSADEYELIREFCLSNGVRSVSDLARDTILQRISASSSHRAFVPSDLVSLSSGLEQIDVALKELSSRISKVLGPVDQKLENPEPHSA